MKRKHVQKDLFRPISIGLIIFLIIISICIVSYTIYKSNEYSKQSNIIAKYDINTSVQVTQLVVGLNADKEALNFGKVPINGKGTRFINITTYEMAIVDIYVTGQMSKFLSVDQNHFTIYPGSNTVPIYISIPENTSIGNYSGKVEVILLRS